ncbi:carbamoyltransferase HypF [bacterium B17]|nr:carbamoyltransferase HypF [bacterium B17]
MMKVRETYDLTGIVQGVGFRPALYRAAVKAGLTGWVQNRSGTVRLCIEGEDKSLDAFINDLPAFIPPGADINNITKVYSEDEDCFTEFSIIESFDDEDRDVVIPADLSMCADCEQEILDASDRRSGYAFTTCTNCGPRYTVVNAVPYDRERTTMSVFPMCDDCRKEYENPNDRRFHAETIACPVCGPKLTLETLDGNPVDGNPLELAKLEISNGKAVAVRGIGGFLLAVDAFNKDALLELRKRKNRPDKPFAVMVDSIKTAKKYCDVSPEAEELLLSPEAPIVILDVLDSDLPLDLITPDAKTLGVMLPNSPLHRLLFSQQFEVLVMTSGNRGGEPICITTEEAHNRLGGIADLILTHDREINLRNDDSLFAIQLNQPQAWRRARGYAPNPVRLDKPLSRNVLAMGAELKNTIALGFDDEVILSPHIGDLEAPEAVDSLEQVAECLPAFMDKEPSVIAVDLHPDMQSSKLGARIAAAKNIPVVEVQHHHAHAAACLAENGRESGLAVVFDGTGLGADGSIWGAELLDVTPGEFNRLATFGGAPLPGGDAAVMEPARQVVGRFAACGIELSDVVRERIKITEEQAEMWKQQCEKGVNAPVSHAAGRVFDSVSVLLGISAERTTYEGQTAIRLESAARRFGRKSLTKLPLDAYEEKNIFRISWKKAFEFLAEACLESGKDEELAMALHEAMVEAIMLMVKYGAERSESRTAVLSGGVFMNSILNEIAVPELEKEGFEVLLHRRTPPNDGCIALGQAVIAGA